MLVKDTASGHVFEITGGNLALDLANTRERRPTPAPLEHLNRYADLVAWAHQAGALDAAAAGALRALAAHRPREATRALTRALALREALFESFSALAHGRRLPPAALAPINKRLPQALSALQLEPVPREGRVAWVWPVEAHLDRPWWPALRAGAELLASPELARLRECAAANCAWLFLDASRNGTRRWCDMKVCGNREKARRFQRRAQLARGN